MNASAIKDGQGVCMYLINTLFETIMLCKHLDPEKCIILIVALSASALAQNISHREYLITFKLPKAEWGSSFHLRKRHLLGK